MTDTAQILSIVRRLEQDSKRMKEEMARMRQELFKSKNKETWGTASDITRLTGWNSEQLRKHRDQNTIDFKCIGKNARKSVYRYNLNSIPDHYLKHQ